MNRVAVRRARSKDAQDVARLLHAFNLEFDTPTPGEEALAGRVAELVEAGEATVIMIGDGPEGLGVLRFREALWSQGRDAYLEELYVVPERRGEGLGRALLEATLDAAREAGAERIELGTEESDTAARGLYESCGFTNFASDQQGNPAQMLFYERDL